MKSNCNWEFYTKPNYPPSIKVKKKRFFFQTCGKLYIYTSYVLFLRKLQGDIFEHNVGVKVDTGSKKQEIREESYAEFLENKSSELQQ